MTKSANTFWYLIPQKNPVNSFEQVFVEINKKIAFYKHQYELTLTMYNEKHESEKKDVDKTYAKGIMEATERYKELMKDGGWSDPKEQHMHASHESGLDYFTDMASYESFELDERFQDFIDLYNKSTLVILYSFLESKTKEICDTSGELLSKKVKYEHLENRNYFKTSITYFDLIVELDLPKIENHTNYFNAIQFIRNKIVHSDSKYSQSKTKIKFNELITGFTSTKEDDLHEFYISNSNTINQLFERITSFYDMLIWQFEKKLDYPILTNLVKVLFGFWFKEVSVKHITTKRTRKGKVTSLFQINPKSKKEKAFTMELTMIYSEENALQIKSNADNKKLSEMIQDRRAIMNLIQSKNLNLLNQLNNKHMFKLYFANVKE